MREYMRIFRGLLFIADLCLVALSFQLAVKVLFVEESILARPALMDSLMLVAVGIWGVFLWRDERNYEFRARSLIQILRPTSSASLKASGVFLAYLFYLGMAGINRQRIALFLLATTITLLALRVVVRQLLEYGRLRGFNTQETIIVGCGKHAKAAAELILSNPQWGIRIGGFIDTGKESATARPRLWRYRDIPCLGRVESMAQILKARPVDWVVFAVDSDQIRSVEAAFVDCQKMGIKSVLVADFLPRVRSRRYVFPYRNHVLFLYDPAPPLDASFLVKSVFDRVGAFVGLAVFWPLMALIAIAIKLTSRGPVLYRQKRLGLGGKPFTLYKFRTMVPEADLIKKELLKNNEMDGPAFKMKDDPRVTPLGRILRRSSLDELPQLFNVLKGDMSLVGPRPPLEEEVSQYDFWQRRRLSVRPGLTCLWQVRGRNNIRFNDWMKMDLEYIDNWSLWLDLKILAKTVPAVLSGRGAR